jgi:hypothetical protein
VDSLVDIAKSSIGLEHLSLGLMPTYKSSLEFGSSVSGLKASKVACTTLQTLSIFDIRHQAPFSLRGHRDLAGLLDILFPNLEAILPNEESDYEQPYWYWWMEVDYVRKMFQALRMYRSSCIC